MRPKSAAERPIELVIGSEAWWRTAPGIPARLRELPCKRYRWIRIYDDGSDSCDEKLEARYRSVERARARYLGKVEAG